MKRASGRTIILPDGPRVHIAGNRGKTADAMATDVIAALAKTPPGQTILLATGVTMLEFYPLMIAKAKKAPVDLSVFTYGHLDTYVWRPSRYSAPGKEDFIAYLWENFLKPADIPANHFYPLNGFTEYPENIATSYSQWLSRQHIAMTFLGMGPVPEVHLAYMQAGVPLTQSVHYSTLSPATIKRNVGRGEHVPHEVITVGPADLRRATHKFVLAFGKEQEVRAALTGPVTTDVVATALRTDGFRETVHLYLDAASSRGLT